MRKFNKLTSSFSSTAGNSGINFRKVGLVVSTQELKNQFSNIKKLANIQLAKNDRKKVRQDIILAIVNIKNIGVEFTSYEQLAQYSKTSVELRELIKVIKDAVTGLSSMMDDYRDKNITFESWHHIVQGRDEVKKFNQDKSEVIRLKALELTALQEDYKEKEKQLLNTLPMESKIDHLTIETIPKDRKVDLSKIVGDISKLSSETRRQLNIFKAEELKKYENSPGVYVLPERK